VIFESRELGKLSFNKDIVATADNQALHLTTIPLRSIAAGEIYR